MSKSEYFDGVKKVKYNDLQNPEFCAWFFAECSRLAYRNQLRARKEFRRIGFTTYNFYSVEGAQVHIAKNSDKIIIAFRGTEPKQMSDIKADLLAIKRKSKTEGRVHMGFKLELRKLWSSIEGVLQRNKTKKLWITGHSLGGAMATLCASRLEEREPILYTYGSPRVGGKEFCDGMQVTHYRFVNNNDVVTGVPFWLMGYRHHGDLQYINYYGNIRKMSWWQRFKDSWRGRGKALKKFQLFDGMYDHSITGYADKLGKLL